MVNPYANIITPSMKTTFNNMIEGLLADSGCTIPCEITYGGQQFTDCANCQGGIYVPGGSIPFPNGMICPLCQGTAKFEVVQTETIYLLCIFDSKQFRSLPTSIKSLDMAAQTMSKYSLYPKLKAAKTVVLDVTNKLYSRNVYKRAGEPQPCGFGSMNFILTSWERIQ